MVLTNKTAELYVKLLIGLTMPGCVKARNKLFSSCRLDFTQEFSRNLRKKDDLIRILLSSGPFLSCRYARTAETTKELFLQVGPEKFKSWMLKIVGDEVIFRTICIEALYHGCTYMVILFSVINVKYFVYVLFFPRYCYDKYTIYN